MGKERQEDATGFWPNYRPPANHTLAAIQYPLDERWQNRVLNGVLKDARERLALKEPSQCD